MDGTQILKERTARKWEQQETAARLQVSQPYLSLIEAGKRPVTDKLARRAVRLFELPPTYLPLQLQTASATASFAAAGTKKAEELLASKVAGLGYPKFSHLKRARKVNPAEVLIGALEMDDVESRTVEALPWLVFNYSDTDWAPVVRAAKLSDAQNRLGFLLSLAHARAASVSDDTKKKLFKHLLAVLEKSRLARDDSFQRHSLTVSEKVWLKKNRSSVARRWRFLSNLSAEHLVF